MSSAEIDLGAHAYIRAIEENIPDVIKANPQDYGNFQLAFRDMSKQLTRLKAINKDADGKWIVDSEAIANISEKDAEKFLPFYQTVVMAHQKSDAALIRDGKADYIKEFRELHADTIFEIEPETLTRMRSSDMQAIASSALNLLEATYNSPADAAFVPGLDQASLSELSANLEASGYLLPGQNPDRTAPLGDQPLRGTAEQMDNLILLSTQISTNLDLPATVNQADKPMVAAMLLKRAVDGASYENIEIDPGFKGSYLDVVDSDLQNVDCEAIYNVVASYLKMTAPGNATYDTASPNALRIKEDLHQNMKIALDQYYEQGVDNALLSGNFNDPKMNPKEALELGRAINYIRDGLDADMENQFTGDDGGMDVQGGKSRGLNRDFEEEYGEEDIAFDLGGEEEAETAVETEDEAEFDSAEDRAAKDKSRGTVSAPIAYDADADLGADIYGRSDNTVLVSAAYVNAADPEMIRMLDSGTLEYLRVRGSVEQVDLGEIASSRAAFGSIEEAAGLLRQETADYTNAFAVGRVVTKSEIELMRPERKEKLHLARIEPGRGVFKGYTVGNPYQAGKRVRNFIENNMIKDDGTPNLKMRAFLRDAAENGVEATWRSEGGAVLEVAHKFIERDLKEIENRKRMQKEARGITPVEFDSAEIRKFLFVKEASGTAPAAKVIISQDGSVALSDPDAPKIVSRIEKAAPNLAAALEKGKPGIRLGGMISTEDLKAAVQTGTKKISILLDGDNPFAAIGKTEEENVLKREKPKQIVLS